MCDETFDLFNMKKIMKRSAITGLLFCIASSVHGQSAPPGIIAPPVAESAALRERQVIDSNLASTSITPVPQPITGLNNAPDPQTGPSRAALSLLEDQLREAGLRASSAEQQARDSQRSIPLLILLVLFVIPLAFVSGVFFARYRNFLQLNQTVRKLLESGVAVPPEILTPLPSTGPPMSNLNKGLNLIWSGFSLSFLFRIVSHSREAMSLGLIPVFIGLAYLVHWLLDRRSKPA
jgi:hypothetical protein